MTEAHVHNFNPKYLGPGVWWVIHMTAAKANTYSEKIEAKNMIENICRNFFCETCKTHFVAYLKKHPLEDVMNVNLGLFKWTVDFHNAGNLALKKSTLSLDEAKQLYLGSESTCKAHCGGDTTELGYENVTVSDQSIPTIVTNSEVEERKSKKNADTFKTVSRRITYTTDLFDVPKAESTKVGKIPRINPDLNNEITFVRSRKPSHHSHQGKHDDPRNSRGHSRKITYIKY